MSATVVQFCVSPIATRQSYGYSAQCISPRVAKASAKKEYGHGRSCRFNAKEFMPHVSQLHPRFVFLEMGVKDSPGVAPTGPVRNRANLGQASRRDHGEVEFQARAKDLETSPVRGQSIPSRTPQTRFREANTDSARVVVQQNMPSYVASPLQQTRLQEVDSKDSARVSSVLRRQSSPLLEHYSPQIRFRGANNKDSARVSSPIHQQSLQPLESVCRMANLNEIRVAQARQLDQHSPPFPSSVSQIVHEVGSKDRANGVQFTHEGLRRASKGSFHEVDQDNAQTSHECHESAPDSPHTRSSPSPALPHREMMRSPTLDLLMDQMTSTPQSIPMSTPWSISDLTTISPCGFDEADNKHRARVAGSSQKGTKCLRFQGEESFDEDDIKNSAPDIKDSANVVQTSHGRLRSTGKCSFDEGVAGSSPQGERSFRQVAIDGIFAAPHVAGTNSQFAYSTATKENALKVVIFDFDCTLTSFHVFASLAGIERHRLGVLPPYARTERGQISRLCDLDIDPDWGPGVFAFNAFGGPSRVMELRCALEALQNSGVQCMILSLGLVGPIRRCLEQVNLLEFFTCIVGNTGSALCSSSHVFMEATEYDRGLMPYDDRKTPCFMDQPSGILESKSKVLQTFMEEKKLRFPQVVFIDDDFNEIGAMQYMCRTIHASVGTGVQKEELRLLRNMLGETYACDVAKSCESP